MQPTSCELPGQPLGDNITSADHFEAGAALPVLRKHGSSHLMSLSKQNILDVSDMPQKQAAKELGICLSTLRKLCAEHVIELALLAAPFLSSHALSSGCLDFRVSLDVKRDGLTANSKPSP